MELFQEFHEAMERSHNLDCEVVACFLYCVRKYDLPIFRKELYEYLNIGRNKGRELHLAVQKLHKTLGLKIKNLNPKHLITFLLKKYSYSKQIIHLAQHVLNDLQEWKIGKKPSVVAGTIIWYLISECRIEKKITQAKLCQELYINENSVRQNANDIKKLIRGDPNG
jgi:transcription initiation factor TFIIIB Brf1 subunit/transcription initiation factor TFIIB